MTTITVDKAFQMLDEKYGNEYANIIKKNYIDFLEVCKKHNQHYFLTKGNDVSSQIFAIVFRDHPDDKWMLKYKVVV